MSTVQKDTGGDPRKPEVPSDAKALRWQEAKALKKSWHPAFLSSMMNPISTIGSRSLWVLQVPERSAARMATRAAIESALEDNHVSEAEMDLIVGAARPLGLSDAQLARIVEALQDHDLDPEERAMLDEMLATIPDEEE